MERVKTTSPVGGVGAVQGITGIEPMERVKGREFVLQPATGRNACCEACLGTIWRMVQKRRRCKVCSFRVHDKCLDLVIRRPCVSLKLARPDFALLFQLCPEQSLRDQNFQCAECAAPISYDEESEKVPRLCAYTGYLYCRNCHWNDEMVIPARLKRPGCRATKQLLNTTAHSPPILPADLPPSGWPHPLAPCSSREGGLGLRSPHASNACLHWPRPPATHQQSPTIATRNTIAIEGHQFWTEAIPVQMRNKKLLEE